MTNRILIVLLAITVCACSRREPVVEAAQEPFNFDLTLCAEAEYPEWSNSPYVLPYPVGDRYSIGLSNCSGSYHGSGEPDQFAVDFDMPFNSLITNSRAGRVVFVEESGMDGNSDLINNLVVVRHDDNTYTQYMHLTFNGALVEVGDIVQQGDSIGLSGATGLAGYPHLHMVVTGGGWRFPYTSRPFNFKNTTPNPNNLETGKFYRAEPY